MTVLSADQLGRRFVTLFKHTAYRLEFLDYYVAANEREPFRRFLAGQPNDPAWREPWKTLVKEARKAGKSMARVHVVTEPLSDYVTFELTWTYPANVDAGEDVRILPRDRASSLDLPGHDYWLFDSRQVGLMTYDPGGNLIQIELADNPELAARHCHWRDVALHHSVPLADYLREQLVHHPEAHSLPPTA